MFLSRQQTSFTNPQMALDDSAHGKVGYGAEHTRLIGENSNPTLSPSIFSYIFVAPCHLSSCPRLAICGDKSPSLSWLRAHVFLENNKEYWVDSSFGPFAAGCSLNLDPHSLTRSPTTPKNTFFHEKKSSGCLFSCDFW